MVLIEIGNRNYLLLTVVSAKENIVREMHNCKCVEMIQRF